MNIDLNLLQHQADFIDAPSDLFNDLADFTSQNPATEGVDYEILERGIGFPHTPESKARQSAVLKAHWAIHQKVGHPHTEECKARLSAKHMGKVFTEEHKKNISKNHSRIAPNIGIPPSEATRAKISASLTGVKLPDRTGRKRTPEQRARIAEGTRLAAARKRAEREQG